MEFPDVAGFVKQVCRLTIPWADGVILIENPRITFSLEIFNLTVQRQRCAATATMRSAVCLYQGHYEREDGL